MVVLYDVECSFVFADRAKSSVRISDKEERGKIKNEV